MEHDYHTRRAIFWLVVALYTIAALLTFGYAVSNIDRVSVVNTDRGRVCVPRETVDIESRALFAGLAWPAYLAVKVFDDGPTCQVGQP